MALRRDGGLAVPSVRVHGPGVPESELAEIFRPFYPVASARDQESGSVGLGLAITDRVARLHGGSVGASNMTDGGLEIQVVIPIAEDSERLLRQSCS